MLPLPVYISLALVVVLASFLAGWSLRAVPRRSISSRVGLAPGVKLGVEQTEVLRAELQEARAALGRERELLVEQQEHLAQRQQQVVSDAERVASSWAALSREQQELEERRRKLQAMEQKLRAEREAQEREQARWEGLEPLLERARAMAEQAGYPPPPLADEEPTEEEWEAEALVPADDFASEALVPAEEPPLVEWEQRAPLYPPAPDPEEVPTVVEVHPEEDPPEPAALELPEPEPTGELPALEPEARSTDEEALELDPEEVVEPMHLLFTDEGPETGWFHDEPPRREPGASQPLPVLIEAARPEPEAPEPAEAAPAELAPAPTGPPPPLSRRSLRILASLEGGQGLSGDQEEGCLQLRLYIPAEQAPLRVQGLSVQAHFDFEQAFVALDGALVGPLTLLEGGSLEAGEERLLTLRVCTGRFSGEGAPSASTGNHVVRIEVRGELRRDAERLPLATRVRATLPVSRL